jgi:hypothetical protein
MGKEMSFHEAVSSMSEMVDFLVDSDIGKLYGAVLGFGVQAACYSHLEKMALLAEQEHLIIADDWETVTEDA